MPYKEIKNSNKIKISPLPVAMLCGSGSQASRSGSPQRVAPTFPKRGNYNPLNPPLIRGNSSLWQKEARRDFKDKQIHKISPSPLFSKEGYFRVNDSIRGKWMACFCGLIMFILTAFCLLENAGAMVLGQCSYCHSSSGGPSLLKKDCIGCHAQNSNGTQNIIPYTGGSIPQVLHHMERGDLAGGNYYYVADGYNPDYSKGHNVLGISNRQPAPMDKPPGFKESVIIPGGIGPISWPQQKQLTCAGTWGCHGDRTIEDPLQSVLGSHHTDDSVIDGQSAGTSYRFLNGIKGKEHASWEYQSTIDNHNGYKGSRDYTSMDTISYLCGECHAQFHLHSNLGGGYTNVWVRHPVDISFSRVSGGYVGSEYQGYTTYSVDTPVAFADPAGTEISVDMNSIVMCLTCHRAHASPYKNMLRWDYSEMIAGGNGPKVGCATCHTRKVQ